ncbi:MAG: VCBS repeat-containing protein, partial [Byssovorax sp.]
MIAIVALVLAGSNCTILVGQFEGPGGTGGGTTGGGGGTGGGTTVGGTTAGITSSTGGGNGGSGGSPCVPVDDSNPCTDDTCDNGVPVHPNKASGSACDDGDACTKIDTCQAGACVGGDSVVCNGGAKCVAGVCVAPVCTGTLGLPGPPSSSVGSQPNSVAAADLNGDGKTDLAVANTTNVSVLLNQGNGTFAAINYAAGSNPTSVVAADLNGDGKADLAIANKGSGNVSVLLNLGNGTFAAAVNYAAGSNAASVAAVDLNGDGKPDLAVTNSGSGNVSVLLNLGNGTFAAAV